MFSRVISSFFHLYQYEAPLFNGANRFRLTACKLIIWGSSPLWSPGANGTKNEPPTR